MSSHIPNPLPPDQDRGPRMMGAFWTMVSVSTMMVALRFYARFRIKSIGWDDYMMLVTQVFFILGNSLVTHMVHNGGGRHVWYLSEEQILLAEKWSYISQVPILLVYATAKTSVALLTLRFMGNISVWRRSLLIFIIGTVIVVNLLTIILSFVQCTPSYALWTKVEGASCWPRSVVGNFNYFSRAWNVFVDIVLALVPVSFIYKLKMKQSRKIGLAVLLSLGLFAALCGGIKEKYEKDLTERSDFTCESFLADESTSESENTELMEPADTGVGYNIQMWSEVEAFLLIFAGCVPTLLPLWERYVTHKLDSSYGRTPLQDIGGPGQPTAAKGSLGSTPYTVYDRSRTALNSTTIKSGSDAELELMPPMPQGIHIKSSYGVNHRPSEFA